MTETTTTTIPALLPCPFCGAEEELLKTIDQHSNYPRHWLIQCENGCACAETDGLEPDEAVAAWNRRAAPSAAQGWLDFRPNIGAVDAEPSLRRMVEMYYAVRIDDAELAARYAADYLAALPAAPGAQPAQDSLTEAAAAVLHEYDHPATGDGNLFGKMQALRLALSAARAAQPVGEVASVLWCVHHIGPDDLHPVEDYEAAVKMADAINDQSEKFNFGHKPDSINYVYSRAYPAIWTGTPESHAEWLEKRRAAALRTAGEEANG